MLFFDKLSVSHPMLCLYYHKHQTLAGADFKHHSSRVRS